MAKKRIGILIGAVSAAALAYFSSAHSGDTSGDNRLAKELNADASTIDMDTKCENLLYPDDFQGPLVDSDGVFSQMKATIKLCVTALTSQEDDSAFTPRYRHAYATVELESQSAGPQLAADLTLLATMKFNGRQEETARWQTDDGKTAAVSGGIKCGSKSDKTTVAAVRARLGAADYPDVAPVVSRELRLDSRGLC